MVQCIFKFKDKWECVRTTGVTLFFYTFKSFICERIYFDKEVFDEMR